MPSHPEGIRKRLGAAGASYQAVVWEGKKRRTRTFKREADAKRWRAEQLAASETVKRESLAAPTLQHYATEMLRQMRAGILRPRSGDAYKPSALRAYTTSLKRHVLPVLGAMRLDEITRRDVQTLVLGMYEQGLDPSTVRNATMPLRVAFTHAMHDGIVDRNPVLGVRLQAVRSKRDRVASPAELRLLIDALNERDRIILALAGYAGLRRGEIRALRWANVSMNAISVEQGWDDLEGEIAPKSAAGKRKVPIVVALAPYLERAIDLTSAAPEKFVAPSSTGGPFNSKRLYDRMRRAWQREGLEPIGLHEARHTFASIAIAAGVNPNDLKTIMGHASITTTYDLYGKLMPGGLDVAAQRINDYLGGTK